jgi:hypothetical protein
MELKSHFNRKSVLRPMALLLMVGAAAVAFQDVAYERYPIIAANATCGSGVTVINYTLTSWSPGTLSDSMEVD